MSSIPTDQELEDALRVNAAGPAEAQNETGRIRQHSLQDIIAVDEHLARKGAGKRPMRAVRFTQTRMPGP